MYEALQIVTLLAVALVLTPSLAHALEYPGKLRLTRDDYYAVQPIYYPGFTFAGIAEPLSILLLAVTAYVMRSEDTFWLVLVALLAIAAMHVLYWTLTHPVNNFWLKDFKLKGAGAAFFGANPARARIEEEPEWTMLRDRWEYSHIARAALAALGLGALTAAIALD